MSMGKLAYVSYPVKDWAGAKKFYGETLGMPVAWFMSDDAGWMEFGTDEGAHLAISLVRDGQMANPNGGAMAVFAVEDAVKTVQELRAKGVKCDDPIGIPGMVTYANFYDPEGNKLQIAGAPPAAPAM